MVKDNGQGLQTRSCHILYIKPLFTLHEPAGKKVNFFCMYGHSGPSSSASEALTLLSLSASGNKAATISNVNTSVCFLVFPKNWHHLKEFSKLKMTHVLVRDNASEKESSKAFMVDCCFKSSLILIHLHLDSNLNRVFN